MFGQLSPGSTVAQIQQKITALITAFEDLEDAYLWSSAYSLSDWEAAPMNLPSADAQDILNALADSHNLYQTALGTTGFPTASLPYGFLTSMRMVTGAR